MVTSHPKEINTFIPHCGIYRSDFAIDTFSDERYNIRTNPAYTKGGAFGIDAAYAGYIVVSSDVYETRNGRENHVGLEPCRYTYAEGQ